MSRSKIQLSWCLRYPYLPILSVCSCFIISEVSANALRSQLPNQNIVRGFLGFEATGPVNSKRSNVSWILLIKERAQFSSDAAIKLSVIKIRWQLSYGSKGFSVLQQVEFVTANFASNPTELITRLRCLSHLDLSTLFQGLTSDRIIAVTEIF